MLDELRPDRPRRGAVAVLRTYGVRLVHDEIALRGSSLAQVNPHLVFAQCATLAKC
jgi:hypothetical protein